MTIAVCPGSFDPVTNGHVDIVGRAAKAFDTIVVAIAENPKKQSLFTVPERIEMLTDALAHVGNVKVTSFQGLTTDLCHELGASVIVKGLRAVSDFDFEMQMAQMNARMGVDTMFMATSTAYSYLSSSLMKEVVKYGGSVDGLVPPAVAERLKHRLEGNS